MCADDNLRIAPAELMENIGKMTGLWRVLVEFGFLARQDQCWAGVICTRKFLQQSEKV